MWELIDGMYYNSTTGERITPEQHDALPGSDSQLDQVEPTTAKPMTPVGGKVLGLVGGAVGSYVGGAAGGAIGSTLGKAVGGGGSVGDATKTQAKEGATALIGSYFGGQLGGDTNFVDAPILSEVAQMYANEIPASNALLDQVGNSIGTSELIKNATPATPVDMSIIDKFSKWGQNQLSSRSYGLLKEGPYTPSKQTDSFLANMGEGRKHAGDLGTAYADLKDGNYGSMLGNAGQFTLSNYQPPKRKRYY